MVTLNKYVFKTIAQKYFIIMYLVYGKSRFRCLFTLVLTPKPVSLTCTCKSSVQSNATQVFQYTRASGSLSNGDACPNNILDSTDAIPS